MIPGREILKWSFSTLPREASEARSVRCPAWGSCAWGVLSPVVGVHCSLLCLGNVGMAEGVEMLEGVLLP